MMPFSSIKYKSLFTLTLFYHNFFIQNFTEHVGTKSTFRLLNRGSAKALDKVAELYGNTYIGLEVFFPFCIC